MKEAREEEKKFDLAYQHKIGSTKIKQKKEDISCITGERGSEAATIIRRGESLVRAKK